jgi:sulfite reductase beta subunit-like hemoprotein
MPKEHTIEQIKAEGLEVDFAALATGGFAAVAEDDFYRLKTKGVCSARKAQQDFMIRIRVPSGALEAAQATQVADLADRYARGWVHLSTRQNVELHMVQAESAALVLRGLGEVGLSTRSTCGDTIRNLAVCECAGVCPTEAIDVRPWARLLHDHFLAWADYYDLRIPRKVNIYLADCIGCADEARINDVSLVGARHPETGEAGLALWAAGGQGGQQPRLGQLLRSWLPATEALAATRAVLQVFIDHGERNIRGRAKLKFVVDKHGWEWFAARFEEALPIELERIGRLAPPSMDVMSFAPFAALPIPPPAPLSGGSPRPSGAQPHPNSPGHYRLDMRVVLGELSSSQLRSLADLAVRHADGRLWLTKRQNAEFRFVPGDQLVALAAGIESLGLRLGLTGGLTDVMGCVGMEFCPIGLTSTQAVAAQLIERFETTPPPCESARLRVNLSGCPNSCGQHHVGDVGLSGLRLSESQGGGPGYQLFLGGRLGLQAGFGAAIARVRQTDAARATQAATELFQAEHQDGEEMADLVARLGPERIREELERRLGDGVLIGPTPTVPL